MCSLTRFIRLLPVKTQIFKTVRNLTSNNVVTIQHLTPVLPIENPWIWRKNDEIKSPILNRIEFDLPKLRWIPPVEDPKSGVNIQEMPSTEESTIEKQAVRMIVIRRKKMKKHKLKKLRKRMKFEWGKRRQRRELKKEKDFQAVLISQCKEAEAFSAEQYVNERISKLHQLRNLVNETTADKR